MNLVIDHVATLDDWEISDESGISLNEFSDKIAGLNDASLLAAFSEDDDTQVLSKSYDSIDISDYDTLILSAVSRNYGKDDYSDNTFYYKIAINDSNEYYLPVNKTFNNIDIAIDDVDTLDKIEITALHGEKDYLWISEIVVEKQDLAIDIMEAVKEHLEYYIDKAVGDGLTLGTVSGSSGDSQVTFPDISYLEQYAVFKISDGTNEETHQIESIGRDLEVTFMSTFDGSSLQNDYDEADLILTFPVHINPDEKNICLPGLTVWGFTPTPLFRTGMLDHYVFAYNTDGSVITQAEGQLLTMALQIDCEARQSYLLNICAKAVRYWLENQILWVSGRFHELSWNDPAIETPPSSGIDIIPKLQYNLAIEAREMFADRQTYYPVTDTTLTINMEEDD